MPDDPRSTPPGDDREAATGRERLRDAFLRPSRAQLVVGVLLAVLGFAAIVQVQETEVADTFAGYREQELIDVLNGLYSTMQRAEAEIDQLEETRDELRSDTTRRKTALEAAQEDVETLNILAGLVPVTGPGVRVTVREVDAPVDPAHLVDMVQELRTAGAEAIQVNGKVRLVAQSAFEDAEGGIVVDGQRLEPPYVFDVIGEPANLENALTFLEGPRTNIERNGGTMEIAERKAIDIEAVRRPVEPEYAEPQPGQ